MDYFVVLLGLILAFMLVATGLIASRLFAPHRPGVLKNTPYECGEKTIGTAWLRFNVGYYIFALLFLVFDVEAAFLFPWAVTFREFGVTGFVEVAIFVFVLVVGLAYAWKKGLLEWV